VQGEQFLGSAEWAGLAMGQGSSIKRLFDTRPVAAPLHCAAQQEQAFVHPPLCSAGLWLATPGTA